MLITLEKVLILRTVGLFEGTPDDLLAEVAHVAEEVHVAPGDNIIRKGETGESMFVIAEGEVNIHDGEKTLVTLGARQVFGELAALVPEARTASATAKTDALLLEIHREALFHIMETNIQVAEGVIRVLVGRIRQMSAQLAGK